MDELKALIKKILQQGYLLSLASVDDHGLWVSDIIYISDVNLNLYFVSRLEFRHSKAFLTNPKAAGSITAVEKPEGQSTGVQMEGIVTQIKSIPEDALMQYSKKRISKTPYQLAEGEVWYKFTPTKIDIIYETLFGYTKKSLTLTP